MTLPPVLSLSSPVNPATSQAWTMRALYHWPVKVGVVHIGIGVGLGVGDGDGEGVGVAPGGSVGPGDGDGVGDGVGLGDGVGTGGMVGPGLTVATYGFMTGARDEAESVNGPPKKRSPMTGVMNVNGCVAVTTTWFPIPSA